MKDQVGWGGRETGKIVVTLGEGRGQRLRLKEVKGRCSEREGMRERAGAEISEEGPCGVVVGWSV